MVPWIIYLGTALRVVPGNGGGHGTARRPDRFHRLRWHKPIRPRCWSKQEDAADRAGCLALSLSPALGVLLIFPWFARPLGGSWRTRVDVTRSLRAFKSNADFNFPR